MFVQHFRNGQSSLCRDGQRGRVLQCRVQIERLGAMTQNGGVQRVGQDAVLVHFEADKV